MTNSMNDNDLVAFLRARLDEDEQAARAATPGGWVVEPYVYGAPEDGWGEPQNFEVTASGRDVVSHQPHEGGGIDQRGNAEHIARHDPARVLAEVEAKRRILQGYEDRRAEAKGGGMIGDLTDEYETVVLPLLALPYADHPDYQDAWRP